jgi:hypothetical protein
MRCKDLEFVIESEGLGTLSAEAREHLADCANCQGLLADLHSIVAVAGTLPAEVEPPARVWTSLRAQLEAEGLIKEPVEIAPSAPWWESLRTAFRVRTFATAAAGILVVAATLFLVHKPDSVPVATRQPAATQPPVTQQSQPQQQASTPTTTVTATARPAASAPSRTKELAPSPSETASTTLTQAELSFPDMQLAGNARVNASFRQNLRTLNQFIAECERHLRQNPQDELAREYLNMAYQQKADLLAAMMESGRSEH